MRHLNNTCKLNRTTSHRRCLFANMLKALIEHERIETTVPKAKALRRYADRMITLAKRNTLATRRRAVAELMVRFNTLTPKEARRSKEGKTAAHNGDRKVIEKLFATLGPVSITEKVAIPALLRRASALAIMPKLALSSILRKRRG